MTEKKQTVTIESVRTAIESLKAESRTVSVRTIQDKLGYGSISTIHGYYKRVRAETPEIPLGADEKMLPLLSTGLEIVKNATEEATSAFKSEIAVMNKDMGELAQALALAEDEKEGLQTKLAENELALAVLQAETHSKDELIERLKDELKTTSADLNRRTIREEDYREAKAELNAAHNEVAIAKASVARLEGRIGEMEKMMPYVVNNLNNDEQKGSMTQKDDSTRIKAAAGKKA
ncbi:MAG: DNA-binding protein [Deltaproteobacteria bacterium]|jgi:chromosome segregation ATPase|nr:DNA-binding protein [Deltaproteobacteria bacterium]